MTRALIAGLAAACLCVPALHAQVLSTPAADSAVRPTFASSVDWRQGIVSIDAKMDLSDAEAVLPTARFRAEQAIAEAAPRMIESALFPIPVDSFDTIGDLARTNPALMSAAMGVLKPVDKRYSVLSPTLRSLTVRYQIPLFPDVASIFVSETKANPPEPPLGYVPTTKFSGIVIYAKGELPVHGENRSARLRPCLFPRIWDQQMNLVESARTVDPAALRERGTAAYSDTTDERAYADRIGLVPFHTVAVGIFGKNYTDLIIPDDAARTILASPDNVNLLTEGKVLIIADLPPVSIAPVP